MATDIALEAPAQAEPAARLVGNATLLGGFVGRAWLWFIGGCLVVTLLPMLFGWRPYVVESQSMEPRIKVGDVILSSPEHDPQKLLGRVTVFNDPEPAHAGTVKSHRVIRINKDGTLVTKGDANQTEDSTPVKVSEVRGLGRLLVRWVGLPLIWVQNGQWLKLGLFALTLWIGALLVMRDADDLGPRSSDPESSDGAEGGDGANDSDAGGDPDGSADEVDADPARVPLRARLAKLWRRSRGGRAVHRLRRRRLRRFAGRALAVVMASLGLLLPTAQAAFSVTTKNTANTWSAGGGYSETTETKNLGPFLYWKLDDVAGTTATDYSGNARNGTYNSTWTKGVTGPLVNQAANFAATETNAGAPNNSVSCIYSPNSAGIPQTGPTVYSEIIWFKTTSTAGGKLIGFENNRTGVSNSSTSGGQYDRMLYMDGAGKVWFAVWRSAGGALAISSPAAVNDGNWHMAVATMSTTTGMALYIDGAQVATNANTISETETATGYFRVGCGNLAGWGGAATWTGPNAPGGTALDNLNYPFNGTLDEASVFTTTLTAAQISWLYYIR